MLLLLLLLLLGCGATTAVDVELFVSAVSGSDANAGTHASPLQSLRGAAALLSAHAAALGNATVRLFAGERFEACFVVLRSAGSLRLTSTAGAAAATVSCAGWADGSAMGAGAVLELAAVTDVAVDNVRFAGVQAFNASAVWLRATSVALVNVTVADTAVMAARSFFIDEGPKRDDVDVRSPVVVFATAGATVSNCSFLNNSLVVNVTMIGNITGPIGDVLLRSAGGGALALMAADAATVVDCAFEGNALSVTWSSLPTEFFYGQQELPSLTVAGGALLVGGALAQGGTVRSCRFVENSANGFSVGGAAIAFLTAPTANDTVMIVEDSSFVGNSANGTLVVGGVVLCAPAHNSTALLAIVNSSFADTVVFASFTAIGTTAWALQLVATVVSVTGSSATAANVHGAFAGVRANLTQVDVSDNSCKAQWTCVVAFFGVPDPTSDSCAALRMAQSRVSNNVAIMLAYPVGSMFSSSSEFYLLLRPARCENQGHFSLLWSLWLDNVTLVDNHMVAQVGGTPPSSSVALVSWRGADDVFINRLSLTNNTGGGSALLLAASSVQLQQSIVRDNVTPKTPAVDLVDLRLFVMGDCDLSGGGIFGTLKVTLNDGQMFATNTRVANEFGTALVVDGSSRSGGTVDLVGVTIEGVVFLRAVVRSVGFSNSLLRHCILQLTMLPLTESVAFTNTTLDESSVSITASFGTSDSEVVFQQCTFASTVLRGAPMVDCNAKGVRVYLVESVVDAPMSKRLFLRSTCDTTGIMQRTLVTGSGGAMIGRLDDVFDFFIFDSTLQSTSVDVVSNGRSSIARFACIDCDTFTFQNGNVELVNATFRDAAALAHPALQFSDMGVRLVDVCVRNVSTSGRGVIAIANSLGVNLTDVVVSDCVASRGGAFLVSNVLDVESRNVTARGNRAVLAGGAIFFADDRSRNFSSHVDCVNNSAGAYGPQFAGELLQIEVDNVDDAAMPGVGLVGMRVRFRDDFGNFQLSHPDQLALRSTPLSVNVMVACEPRGGGAELRQWAIACVVGVSDAECAGNVALPLAKQCNVSVTTIPPAAAPKQFSVRIMESCRFGFGASSNLCRPCPPDFASPGNGSECELCPVGARCCGAARVKAKPEFWIDKALRALRCLPGACVGGSSTCSADETRTAGAGAGGAAAADSEPVNVCVAGRAGALCSHCTGTGTGNTLIPIVPGPRGACLECNELDVLLLVGVIAAVGVFALVIHFNAVGNSAALKILTYFTQMAGLQAPRGLFAETLATAVNFRVAAATASFGGLCLAPWNHWQLTAARLSLPVLMLASLAVVALLARLAAACRRRARRAASPTVAREDEVVEGDGDDDAVPSALSALRVADANPAAAPFSFGGHRLLRSAIAILLTSFSVALAASLDVLQCVDVGGEQLLASDTRESCTSDAAVVWRRVVMFGLLPGGAALIVALPAMLLVLRHRNGARLPERHEVLGVLFECYRSQRAKIFFEAFVLLRRSAAGLTAVLVSDPLLRHFLFTAVNVSSLLAVVLEQPYVSTAENRLDVFAQFVLCLLGCMSVDVVQLPAEVAWVAAVVSCAPVALIVAFMTRMRLRGLWLKLRAAFRKEK
jgi:hypothetical protein